MPRHGETFVTRKITRGLPNVSQGLEKCLYLGGLDVLRDWGYAKDYVRMQWMMSRQELVDVFVIATGKQISAREFVRMSTSELGVELEFKGRGVNEMAIVKSIAGVDASGISVEEMCTEMAGCDLNLM